MAKLTLIIGGARSGKSRYALKLGEEYPPPRAFIATAEALDPEMEERINRHRMERGLRWETIEEPVKVVELLEGLKGRYRIVLLDCLTLWLSNLLRLYRKEEIDALVERLVQVAASLGIPLLLVTNEVGMGIVPENELARLFRDLVGRTNAYLAEAADEVYILFAGLPVRLK